MTTTDAPAPSAREIDSFIDKLTDAHGTALVAAEASGRGFETVAGIRAAFGLGAKARDLMEQGEKARAAEVLALARDRFEGLRPVGL